MNPLTKMNMKRQLLLLTVLLLTPVFLMNWFANEKAEDILKNQVTSAYIELIKQNHMLIERDIDTVGQITTTIIQHAITQEMIPDPTLSTFDRVQKFSEMNKLLSSYSSRVSEGESLLYSLFIPDPENDYFFAPKYIHTKRGVYFFSEAEKPEWYDEALERKGEGFLKVITNFGSNAQHTLAYIRAVYHIKGERDAIGVLVVTNIDKLVQETIDRVSLPEGEIMFLDLDDVLLAGTPSSIGTAIPLPRTESFELNEEPVNLIHSDYIYVMNHHPVQRNKLVFQIPVKILLQQQNALRNVIQAVSLVYFIVCFIVMLYFFRSLINPLTRMAGLFKSYEPGRPLPSNADMKRKDEIGVIISSFYGMTHRLNDLIYDKYVMELKQKETELQLLYEQMNPHLLYNTLESIYWKSALQGDTESAQMIKELSKLMKIGLSRGKDLITLEKELEHVRAYAGLQQKRFDYMFQVQWSIDPQALPYVIPKIVLQPLVENAILHGVRVMGEDGEIIISARLDQEQIVVRVEDNGYKRADLEAIRHLLQTDDGAVGSGSGSGYGLRNVDRRIKMHFGQDYGLRFAHRQPQGTMVEIRLPAALDP